LQALYRLIEDSRLALTGCTDEMCSTSWHPRGLHWQSPADSVPSDDDDEGEGSEGKDKTGKHKRAHKHERV